MLIGFAAVVVLDFLLEAVCRKMEKQALFCLCATMLLSLSQILLQILLSSYRTKDWLISGSVIMAGSCLVEDFILRPLWHKLSSAKDQ